MDAFILMTRVPIEGEAKTRLIGNLSKKECANLQLNFLKDIISLFDYVKNYADIFITYTPEDKFKIIRDIIPYYVIPFPQKGISLGERMKYAFEYVLSKHYDRVVLMGSDIPMVKYNHIIDAFKALYNNDVVIGPTFDGGYYLLGMKRLYKSLFDDSVKWGGESVFERTVNIARENNLNVSIAQKNRDIDTYEDLIYLAENISNCKKAGQPYPYNTGKFLEKIGVI
ncbi:TIGR04282 family arsenosugar biosynthesis glycosyltransferase [Caloramator sp. E03]|uniref:TIGR04282 family arsenosugar biosynthesis glycosyltransferase n=1 Tax=Caloramator sp. E03 TaxID=2576307 RepID=UPI00143D54FB|nr:TIGR04282 family arsenosugar biosynthesis glycosyltransferase [Caloramator sp. E03]